MSGQAIITGANGQDGYYLAQILRENGIEPTLVCSASGLDLKNPEVVFDLVDGVKPDYIFHLAAKSTVAHSAHRENHDLIATASLNFMEAVRETYPKCRVFIAGSAYQFQNIGKPIKETDPWDVESVYCAARCYSAMLASFYRSKGVMAYVGYFFHHDSPRRGKRHLSQKIADAARLGTQITINDAAFCKEWTWAGDTMEAAFALVNQDEVFDANIGTGNGYSIEEFCDACFSSVGKNYRAFFENAGNEAPVRSITANSSRIRSIGWQPKRDLEYLAYQMTHA